MELTDLDYTLPRELIALQPIKPRDASKLIINEEIQRIIKFKNLVNELNPGDAIVFNDTKVISSDFDGYLREKKISITLNKLADKKSNTWGTFIKTKISVISGDKILVFNRNHAQVLKIIETEGRKEFLIKFDLSLTELKEKLQEIGRAPLPPYIKKRGYKKSDKNDYQTVFAKNEGAVAAPTASLHFTKNLISKLEKKK